jgi:hypothetical protein
LRRRMQELKMEAGFITLFLSLFDFLTVVDRSMIEDGVEYIRRKARTLAGYKKNDHKTKVKSFIDDYFLKQWVRPRMIPYWNYNGKEGWQTEM